MAEIIPKIAPFPGRRGQRRMAKINGNLVFGQPAPRVAHEISMLIKADDAPAAAHHLQRACRNQGGCTGADLYHHLRRARGDDVDDAAQHPDIGFPAAQIGQRIGGQIKPSQQSRLVPLATAIKALQKPGPPNRPEGEEQRPIARPAVHPYIPLPGQQRGSIAGCHGLMVTFVPLRTSPHTSRI